MKLFQTLCVGMILLPASSLWSQVDSTSTQPATANSADSSTANSDNSDSRMLTPPPVSGQSYPTSPTSEERSNYLRTGVAFTSAYTDNALGSLIGHPVSDVSYSVYPMLALDETTSRAHAVLNYAPGFTFYQRESGLNSENQNVAINFHYRVSPHVGLSVGDSFQKTSNVFNQPDLTSSALVSGGSQMPNSSVIPPTAETLNNFGNVGVTYQFALTEWSEPAERFPICIFRIRPRFPAFPIQLPREARRFTLTESRKCIMSASPISISGSFPIRPRARVRRRRMRSFSSIPCMHLQNCRCPSSAVRNIPILSSRR